MTKDLILSLLNRAATGNEMMAVIDGFNDTQPAEVEYNEPTLEPIEFWGIVKGCCATLRTGTAFSQRRRWGAIL